MAMDLETTNGVHNGTNGLDTDGLAQAPHTIINGGNNKPVNVAAPVDPVVNVSSGIEGVAELLASQQDNNSLFGGSDVGVSSALDAVEAPTSDVREEVHPDTSAVSQISENSTQKVPETQLASNEAPADEMDISQHALDTNVPVDPSPAPTKPMTDLSLENQQNDLPSEAPQPDLSLEHQPDLSLDTQQSQIATPNLDQEMEDAPASGKVRPREDDPEDMMEEERDAKRARTQEEAESHTTSMEQRTETPSALASLPMSVPHQGTSAVQTAVGYKEWPASPMTEAQRKFLLERVRNTKKIKVSGAFKDPVDPIALGIPSYPDFVKQPMDLSTIETKLKGGKYTYIAEFMADLDQMIINSELFNSSNHPITQSGYNMRAYFLKGTDRLPKEGEDLAKVSKTVKKPSATVPKPRRESRVAPNIAKSPTAVTPTAAAANDPWPLGTDGMPLIRRESTTNRPQREIHRPSKDLPYNTAKPRKKKYQNELKFCESVLTELSKPKYSLFAFPFQAPVDPVALNIPSYLKIIKKPMDFGTIEKNLKAGQYQSAKDFHSDAMLVFANCYKFNPEGDEVNKMGKRLNELFDSLWSEKAAWLARHAPQDAGSHSPGYSDEDEEEEEEEEPLDPNHAHYLAIQQQIQQLNETAEKLLHSSKVTKAGGKKKAAPKPAVQHKRKNTQLSVPPPPKNNKQKARARPPAPLSYVQKQEISDGISTLGDADMRRAVQIIRNGCPNLAATNDDEMELDMDEINDDTLRDLLKFIKAVRGPKATAADDDYDPPQPAYNKPTASRPKKNKPMGKFEQEDSLRKIQEKMQSFSGNGPASGSDQSPTGKFGDDAERCSATDFATANQGDDSSEDESSASESEEE
jgi:bromodomain-containing factor 1